MSRENEVARTIVDVAYHIHVALGPGLLESVYVATMQYELTRRDLRVRRQVPIPVIFGDVTLEEGFRADLIVEDCVIIELKSVEALCPVHFKQVLTYLRLTKLRLGLLINFNEALIKEGIHRVVNGMPD